MEILFKNQFTLTQEDAKEIHKVNTQRYRRTSLLMLCLGVILVSDCVVSWWAQYWYIIMAWVIMVAWLFISRARALRKQLTIFQQQQVVLHNHSPIVKTTMMFDEYMEFHSSNGAKLTVHYDQITFVKKTAHFMIIFYGKVVTVPVKKSGFSKGTPEAFEAFLLEKGVKVK